MTSTRGRGETRGRLPRAVSANNSTVDPGRASSAAAQPAPWGCVPCVDSYRNGPTPATSSRKASRREAGEPPDHTARVPLRAPNHISGARSIRRGSHFDHAVGPCTYSGGTLTASRWDPQRSDWDPARMPMGPSAIPSPLRRTEEVRGRHLQVSEGSSRDLPRMNRLRLRPRALRTTERWDPRRMKRGALPAWPGGTLHVWSAYSAL